MKPHRVTNLPDLSAATRDFVNGLPEIQVIADLCTTLEDITSSLGFQCYVLGQMPSVKYEASNFYISNYPSEWTTEVYTRLMFGDDPVIDQMADAVTPFLWEDTPGYRNPTPRQQAYLDVSEKYGLRRGYAVPIKVHGQPPGVVSFATLANQTVDQSVMPFAAFVATAAYRRAMELVLKARTEKDPQLALSDIEQRVLAAISNGRGTYSIASKCSITVEECNEVIKGLGRKLGYTNRMLLAIRGLQLGFITFNDALHG